MTQFFSVISKTFLPMTKKTARLSELWSQIAQWSTW